MKLKLRKHQEDAQTHLRKRSSTLLATVGAAALCVPILVGATGPATETARAADCAGADAFRAMPETPYQAGTTLYAPATVHVGIGGCSGWTVEVQAQRKACGRWGCSWENMGSPVALSGSRSVSGPNPVVDTTSGERGTHRYRTRIKACVATLGGPKCGFGTSPVEPELTF